MAEFFGDIEKLTLKNDNYRKVVGTTTNMQLVLMSLEPLQEIGFEIHQHTTQFFRIEQGHGKAIVGTESYILHDGSALVVPPNTRHNIINTSDTDKLKLYTIYTPPEHEKECIQKLKTDKEC
jgi:mannose-6-phosphate isomerase-like protein (cupin superfamily)